MPIEGCRFGSIFECLRMNALGPSAAKTRNRFLAICPSFDEIEKLSISI